MDAALPENRRCGKSRRGIPARAAGRIGRKGAQEGPYESTFLGLQRWSRDPPPRHKARTDSLHKFKSSLLFIYAAPARNI